MIDASRQHITFGNLRVAAFAAGLAVAIGAFALAWFPPWWLVAPLTAFLWTGARLERAVQARARLNRAVAFYERAHARLEGRWAGSGGETGDRFLDEAHLYAHDLDLFGKGSLFELLNAARTRIGEETLAAWLKTPAEPAAVGARQEAVRELRSLLDLREDIAVLGEDARTGVQAEALAAWGEAAPQLGPTRPFWVWALSVCGAVAALDLVVLVAAYFGLVVLEPNLQLAGRAYAAAAYSTCGLVVWRRRGQTGARLHAVQSAAHDLRLLAGVVRRLETERFQSARLAALRADLDAAGEPPSERLRTLNALVDLADSREHLLVRLFGPLVLWDVHLIHAIERWRRTSGPAVRRWLMAVGEMEALSSLAGYYHEHPSDVFAELTDGPACFDGEGLGHPLIAEAVVVRNDVRLTTPVRMMVVSGSNMSGKSTLLRTVGVNAVLAQAGAPVRARRLRLTPLGIGASIRVQDSLEAGVSRFYAEITRLGLIMRRAAHEPPVLFLIDELLQGTNSHDRRIGAEAVVRGLVDRGAIGLVTTHDLALVQVAEALGARGANVHFEDVLEEGRLQFDYRMRPGVVRRSNALPLMRSVGLDV